MFKKYLLKRQRVKGHQLSFLVNMSVNNFNNSFITQNIPASFPNLIHCKISLGRDEWVGGQQPTLKILIAILPLRTNGVYF